MCRRYGPLVFERHIWLLNDRNRRFQTSTTTVALHCPQHARHTGAPWFKFGRNSVAFPVLRSKLSGSCPVGIFRSWNERAFYVFCLSPDMNWTIVFRFCKDFSFLPFLCSLSRKNRERVESEISELSFESVLFEECIISNLRRLKNI